MINLVTTMGTISIALDFENAPISAQNFQQYCEDNFYAGTVFHRVINGFMIQGGGMSADMVQKETRAPIENEADNGLKNEIGTLAMARTMEVGRAGIMRGETSARSISTISKRLDKV